MLQSQFSTLIITLTGCVIALAACTATEAPAEETPKAVPSDAGSQSCAISDRQCVQTLIGSQAKTNDGRVAVECVDAIRERIKECPCDVRHLILANQVGSATVRGIVDVACHTVAPDCTGPLELPSDCSPHVILRRILQPATDVEE